MSRVVIVARTRMHGGRVCIGGHDLDDRFQSLRLLDRFGGYPSSDDVPFAVAEVWDIRYYRKHSIRPPHVEDAYVNEHRHVGRVPDLKQLVLEHVRPWAGDHHGLFDGTVRIAASGALHIPVHGRIPRCSTGYWAPDVDLERRMLGGRVRFMAETEGTAVRLPWVGVAAPPERIEAGSLMRVSLSHPFKAENVPEGYYVQISGVL